VVGPGLSRRRERDVAGDREPAGRWAVGMGLLYHKTGEFVPVGAVDLWGWDGTWGVGTWMSGVVDIMGWGG
jgi:hypothetical protein